MPVPTRTRTALKTTGSSAYLFDSIFADDFKESFPNSGEFHHRISSPSLSPSHSPSPINNSAYGESVTHKSAFKVGYKLRSSRIPNIQYPNIILLRVLSKTYAISLIHSPSAYFVRILESFSPIPSFLNYSSDRNVFPANWSVLDTPPSEI